MSAKWGIGHQCVVLDFQDIIVIIEPQVNLLWFPTTNLFVAFVTDFIADQDGMSCLGIDLTFHFRDKTLTGLLTRDMNLN